MKSYILTFLFLFSYFIHIQAIPIQTTVMGNSAKEVVLYSDLHLIESRQKDDFQNNCLKLKLEELFKNQNSQTLVLYEGPSTVNGNDYLLSTNFSSSLFAVEEVCKHNSNRSFNIDPRSYLKAFQAFVIPDLNDQEIYTFINSDLSIWQEKGIAKDSQNLLKRFGYWKKFLKDNSQLLTQSLNSVLVKVVNLYASLRMDIKESIKDSNIQELLLNELKKADIQNSFIIKLIKMLSPQTTLLELKKEYPILDGFLFNLLYIMANESLIYLDIYAILRILKEDSKKIILFAGFAHTENIKNILQKLGYSIEYESKIKDNNFNTYSCEQFLNKVGNSDFADFEPIKITDLKYIS